ncbi:MAG: hypothetical protein V1685_06450, partial [Parcubacteria group bacterium]
RKNASSILKWGILVIVLVIAGFGIYLLWSQGSRNNANSNTNNLTNNVNQNGSPVREKQPDIDLYATNGRDYLMNNWQTIALSNADDSSSEVPRSNFLGQTIETADELINQFTGERYFIQREENSEYCGPNGGTSICNLIKVKKDGTQEMVADLWFPESSNTPDGEDYTLNKYGAKLISFLNADTLQLYFGYVDHGGGFSAVSNYSLTEKKLTPMLEYYQTEGSDAGEYTILSYSFRKGGQVLSFINYDIPDGSAFEGYGQGVFLHAKNGKMIELHFPNGPYSVTFDLLENSTGSNLNLKVNGVDVDIDMTDGLFLYHR